MNPKTVSREAWLAARMELLAKEKELTRQRDAVSAARRELPRVKIEKAYTFQGPEGELTLSELFAGKRQLAIYHFMFGPDWEEGCPSCSFWADNFDGTDVHLAHRDIRFLAISRAPLSKIEAYKERMGWKFDWVSSEGSDFNFDFGVSFTKEQIESGAKLYNFGTSTFPSDEAPGASVFYKDEEGEVFHTYSRFSRGLDLLNGAYHWMDLVPKGRDEADLPYGMAWLRRHDRYED